MVTGVATDTCHAWYVRLNICNNFKLNCDQTKEIVFSASRKATPLPPRPDIERVSNLRVLGVIVNDKLTAADHVTALLSPASSMLYAM